MCGCCRNFLGAALLVLNAVFWHFLFWWRATFQCLVGCIVGHPSLRGDLPVFPFLGAGPGQYLGMHDFWSVCGSQHMEQLYWLTRQAGFRS